MVTDADNDQNKEGVDRDPNERNRKCHNNKADGQSPEDCQEEIQRHQFSWKIKVQSSSDACELGFHSQSKSTPVSKKTVSKKGGKMIGGY